MLKRLFPINQTTKQTTPTKRTTPTKKKPIRDGKLTCPLCKRGQIYYRKTKGNWRCWRCKRVIS